MVNRRFCWLCMGRAGTQRARDYLGRFVRATGSGAGCGSHWPLCQGVVIPRARQDRHCYRVLTPHYQRAGTDCSRRARNLGLACVSQRATRCARRSSPPLHLYDPRGPARRRVGVAGIHRLQRFGRPGVLDGRSPGQYFSANGRADLDGLVGLGGWTGSNCAARAAVGVTYWLAVVAMFVLGISGAMTALGDTLAIAGGISPRRKCHCRLAGGAAHLSSYDRLCDLWADPAVGLA